MQIKLAGELIDLSEATFGQIKKVVIAYNALTKSMAEADVATPMSGAVMDSLTHLIAIALKKTVIEVDAMPITLQEMWGAAPVIRDWAGIKFEKRASAGEMTGVGSTGSTPTS